MITDAYSDKWHIGEGNIEKMLVPGKHQRNVLWEKSWSLQNARKYGGGGAGRFGGRNIVSQSPGRQSTGSVWEDRKRFPKL